MSTTLPDLTYDDCIVLFSNNPKDRRSCLFLSELKNHANNQKNSRRGPSYIPQDLRLDYANMEAARAMLFKEKYGLGDNDLHVEWVFWLASVVDARSNYNQTLPNGRNILRLIQRLSNPQPGSLEDLVGLLLEQKMLASLVDANGSNLMPNRSDWSRAARFTFKDFTVGATSLTIIEETIPVPAWSQSLNNRIISAFNVIRSNRLNVGSTLADLQNIMVNSNRCLLTLIDNNNARGVQINQFITWNSHISTNTQRLENSTHANFSTDNAFDNFNVLNGTLQVAAYGGLGFAAGNANDVLRIQSIVNDLHAKIVSMVRRSEQFGYQDDKYLINVFLKSTVKNTKLPAVSQWFNTPASLPGATTGQEKYYRKHDGTIWERKSDGTEKIAIYEA